MSALQPTTSSAPVSSLVAEINRLHRDVEGHARSMLDSALECGRLLTAAKDALPHGAWLSWLADNFDGSERTAQDYMRLHQHNAEIREIRAGNPQRVADLSLRAALRGLASPRERAADPEALRKVLPGLQSGSLDTEGTVTVDAQVVLDPPTVLDGDQQRQWDRADQSLASVHNLLAEAASDGLAPLSVASAVRDAGHKARRAATLLEGLADDIEARDRKRAA